MTRRAHKDSMWGPLDKPFTRENSMKMDGLHHSCFCPQVFWGPFLVIGLNVVVSVRWSLWCYIVGVRRTLPSSITQLPKVHSCCSCVTRKGYPIGLCKKTPESSFNSFEKKIGCFLFFENDHKRWLRKVWVSGLFLHNENVPHFVRLRSGCNLPFLILSK